MSGLFSSVASRRWPWSVLAAVVVFAVPLMHAGSSPAADWDEFNSLSHFVRSSVASYHTWPLHDPWACGGNDLWANPQQRMFSPLGVLDLALPAHLANLASLIVTAIAGHYLAIRLFEALGMSRRSALVCATLWTASSWFGLHFAAGHIPYGPIQLMPGVALCALRIDQPRAQVGLAALLSLMLLSGGNYAVVFSCYAAISLAPLYAARLRALVREAIAVPRTRWRLALVVTSVAAFAMARYVPARLTGARTTPELEHLRPPLDLLLRMFFDPWQQHDGGRWIWQSFGFQEFGAYIGVLAIGLIVFLLVRRRSAVDRAVITAVVGALFWLWVATGRFPALNPWRLHQSIPIVQMVHVQTRLTIVAWLLLLIPLGRALDALGRRAGIAFSALLVVESTLIITLLYVDGWRDARPVSWPLIHSTTIERTEQRIERPALYFSPNLASAGCYEPSMRRGAALGATDPRYRGEVWVTGANPECHPRLVSFTPDHLEVSLDGCTTLPFELEVNTNHLGGFAIEPAGTVISQTGARLRARIDRPVAAVTLRYAPSHRPWVIGLLILGSAALAGAFVATRRRPSAA